MIVDDDCFAGEYFESDSVFGLAETTAMEDADDEKTASAERSADVEPYELFLPQNTEQLK